MGNEEVSAPAAAPSGFHAGVYARMGKRTEAKQILAGLGDDIAAAAAYAALGDKDEAFRGLFRRVEKREDPNVVWIKTNPQLASLHSDPRWRELLLRMNFPVE